MAPTATSSRRPWGSAPSPALAVGQGRRLKNTTTTTALSIRVTKASRVRFAPVLTRSHSLRSLALRLPGWPLTPFPLKSAGQLLCSRQSTTRAPAPLGTTTKASAAFFQDLIPLPRDCIKRSQKAFKPDRSILEQLPLASHNRIPKMRIHGSDCVKKIGNLEDN